MTNCAIWARVSTHDQKTANQLDVLREWAAKRGLDVKAEFVTEDSAWTSGNGAKGREFDKTRKTLVNGARLGEYSVVLIWALDRLSRKGMKDTQEVLDRLASHDCDVWSHQEDWLQTSSPEMRELLVGLFAWMAKQESSRRSERIKAGLAKRKAAGKSLGGRKPGQRDKGPRDTSGYLRGEDWKAAHS